MRPLPRLLAITDDRVVGAEDFPIKTAAIASAGPMVGIVVRAPGATADHQLKLLHRVRALIRPPEAAFLAHGDAALGAMSEAHGLELSAAGPSPTEARRVFRAGWIGVSVRTMTEAERAVADGADFLVAGNVFPPGSDPTGTGLGLDWLRRITELGVPVFAVGGIGVDQIASVREAGVWGVAAISALWHSTDPARTADQFARELTA